MAMRSLLYTPGNVPRMVAKAGALGADGAVLDLEDSVPLDEKVATRGAVRRAIPAVKSEGGLVYVRTNPIGLKVDFSADLGMGDIEAVVCAGLDGGYVNRCVNDIRRRPSQPLSQRRSHPRIERRDRRLRSTQGPSDA